MCCQNRRKQTVKKYKEENIAIKQTSKWKMIKLIPKIQEAICAIRHMTETSTVQGPAP